MFFRRPKVEAPDFNERLESAVRAGFSVERVAGGSARIATDEYAALVSDARTGVRIETLGRVIGGEIALLEDGGFQKFWSIGGRRCAPALASQLEALHAFEEELKAVLGVENWYNTSLGTTNDLHRYDRLAGREPRRP
ncbi:MAG: hypothetical protein ABSG25_07995 [Bryobacteraceae bacterium]